MKFLFADKKLKVLYETGVGSYSEAVINGFIKKIGLIDDAKNEADLRALKSNKYEKIKSSKTDYSIRINRQYRIELEPLDNGSYKILLIKRISNHYQ